MSMNQTEVTADRLALNRLRAALNAAGYTSSKVLAALGTDRTYGAQAGEVIVFERRLAGHSPLETMIKLFLIGAVVGAADVESALPGLAPGELERMGLAQRVDGGLRSTLRIVPHGDVMIVCDRNYYRDGRNEAADVVAGVSSPSALLADLTVRRHVRRGLDLGAGSGIQSILLAHHCEQVVGVDVNARALRYADLSACLSGVDNVEFRQGSWFEPVEGMRFDVITANPPYVMSPDSKFLYRDSGMRADSLCRQLVRDLPGYLEEGGFAHILISWALKDGQEWSEPLRRWIEGLPCDVWLLHYLTEDPLTQAAKWNRPATPDELESFGAALDRWTGYYAREGIEQIAFGAVIMRRRSGGTNWLRADTFRGGVGSSSALIMRAFAAEDFLEGAGDDRGLLDQKFRLVAESRLEQRLSSDKGMWQLQEATLSLTEGMAFQGNLDINTAQLLQSLDGTKTVRQALKKMNATLELSRADASSLAETAIAMTRRLYQLGFLERSA